MPERAAKSHESRGEEDSDEIVLYLRTHRDFLTGHPDLLEVLAPPVSHDGNGVLDMQAFMVERLQREVGEEREREGALVAAGRSNLVSQGRVHAAILSLLEARGFAELIEKVTTDLAALLDVDVAALCIEAGAGESPRASGTAIRVIETGAVDALIGRGRECLVGSDSADAAALFGEAASLVKTLALVRVRIRGEGPAGLLALGSRDPGRFHPGQGTELLAFLGATLGLAIGGWLFRGG